MKLRVCGSLRLVLSNILFFFFSTVIIEMIFLNPSRLFNFHNTRNKAREKLQEAKYKNYSQICIRAGNYELCFRRSDCKFIVSCTYTYFERLNIFTTRHKNVKVRERSSVDRSSCFPRNK